MIKVDYDASINKILKITHTNTNFNKDEAKIMTTILIRTLIIYVILMLAIKLMGKRQIGEIQVSEFIITLLLAELVISTVTDSDIPLVFMIVPVVALIAVEVISSHVAATKNKSFRPSPTILIEKGEIKQENLKAVRFAINELISEVRQKGYPDITMVDYAILEANGIVSVIPKAEYQNPTVAQLNIAYENPGIAHSVIINGEINTQSVAEAGKTSEWVMQKLNSQGYHSFSEIFLMSVDNADKVFICPMAQPAESKLKLKKETN